MRHSRLLRHGVLALGAVALTACEAPTTPASPGTPTLAGAATRDANATVAWNAVARELVKKHGTGAAPAMRVFALVSVAQYNSIIEAEKSARGPQHPSPSAAVAGASAAVLTYLYPAEMAYLESKVDSQEMASTDRGKPTSFAGGEQIGRTIAAGIIERAKTDRFFEPFTGTVPVCAGCWLPVPTPPAFATLGQAKTFFLASGSQFRPAPPPAFGSPAFLAGLAEVKQIAETRTAEQDSLAKFWALPTGTVSPLGYWNEVATQLIVRYRLDDRRAAHVLALMNMVGYDALVASHEAKYHYWLIRPTQADPSISLSIGLPSFPSYPSNHAAISAGAALVLGEQFPSERRSLTASAEEAAISRVYGAIHYRFDSDAGLELGRAVAAHALERDRATRGHRPFPL